MLAFLRREPATVYITALGTVVALIIAFAHLSGTQAGYLSALATAAGTIITAALARPVNVVVIGGAAAVVLQSLVLFNFHLSSTEIAAVVAAVTFVLGHLALRPNVSPITG